ncbi:MAG: hypothetical protein AB1331_05560 [Bacillota bacterium]
MTSSVAGMVAAALVAWGLRRIGPGLLTEVGLVRPNYAGRPIPTSLGIWVYLAVLVGTGVQHLASSCTGTGLSSDSWLTLAALGAMTLLGLLDDLCSVAGCRHPKGLRGHFGYLWRGQVTTGSLKAAGGAVVALLAAAGWKRPAGVMLVDGLVVLLSTNLINLLDTRPGRAGKAYLVGLAVLGLVAGRLSGSAFLVLAALVSMAPLDLSGRAMLGDAGSNLLGLSLGLTWLLAPLVARMAMAILLVALHLLAEFYSLGRFIEGNRWLYRLDRLGLIQFFPERNCR